jgi:transposase-like protein
MEEAGKYYNEEFKAEIIRLVRDEGRSIASIEKDFGEQ